MTTPPKEHLIYKGEDYYFIPKSSSTQHNHEEDILFPSEYARYRGDWLIEGNKLYLTDLHVFIRNKEVGLDYLFPGEDKVFADWVSGEISLFQDKMTGNVFPRPEKTLLLKIKGGLIMEGWEIDSIHSSKEKFGMEEEYKKKFCRVIYTSRPSRIGLLRAKIEKSQFYSDLFFDD